MNLLPLADASGSLQAALLCVRGAERSLRESGVQSLVNMAVDIKASIVHTVQVIESKQDEIISAQARKAGQ